MREQVGARTLMVQGTMSSAGKSLIAAGLCRIFAEDGFRTAPFKSQNMALNSYVTADGLEMGRAQVMQAEAAGVEPSVLMNPVLLKPTSDTGSQVIVHGRVRGVMDARAYFAYKKRLIPEIMQSFSALASSYDMIVIEGAGSPAEINLKTDDIVNMGMARRAAAPVLLVGDIDRGGVFAQLVGTLELLEEQERAMVKGLIINKFRGDPSLLESGIAMLRERTGIPVVGTVPYMQLDLDDEDSLAERFVHKTGDRTCAMLDIAVIRLPHISNFTDFNVLGLQPGVCVRYVQRAEELDGADVIMLPGTKNTPADLRWLVSHGFKEAVRQCLLRNKHTVVFGICGGYQMLGMSLEDPSGTESSAGDRCDGLGLLPVRTVFSAEKRRVRVSGVVQKDLGGVLAPLGGIAVDGYEIHTGRTECIADGCGPVVRLSEPDSCTEYADGCRSGNVYGTYLHGFFDHAGAAASFVRAAAAAKGVELQKQTEESWAAHKEREYRRLAQQLRESLDMEQIYRIVENGIQEYSL